MTRKMMITLATVCAGAVAAYAAAPADGGPGPVGYDEIAVAADHRARLLQGAVWYPAGAETFRTRVGGNLIFPAEQAWMGPAVAEGQYPLVVFSHGSGGSAGTAAWMGAALAEEGVMTLAVNHPGSTSGDSSPRRSVRLNERSADLVAALDAVLADPAFGPHIDPDRIVVVGFSLGGATALNLAGIQFDRPDHDPFCAGEWREGPSCRFYLNGGVDFANLPDGFSATAGDPRIDAVVAIDPAFTLLASASSVATFDLPLALINLGAEHRLAHVDVGQGGSGFAARVNARYEVLAPANHFTFLPECRFGAQMVLNWEGEDPICTDPAGTDRAVIHGEILEVIHGVIAEAGAISGP